MAVTLSDTYTDTDGTLLTDHDPDVGDPGSWEAMGFGAGGAATGNTLEVNNNRLQPPNVGGNQTPIHRNSTDPGADEYDVAATMAFKASPSGNHYNSICVRMTPTGTADGDVDRYLIFGNGSSTQEWQLYKSVSGSLTLLDSAAASLAGNTFDVRVEVRTGSIEVYADGGGGESLVVSTTDTDITQRGRAGVGCDRGASDHWLDDLTVDSVTSGTPVGQVTETDLAQPIGAAKARTLGQVAETDTAQPIAALKARALGQSAETDLAQPVTALKTRALGQATETDQALPITGRKTKTLGQATEADTALALVIAAVADPNPTKLSFTEPARHVTHAESAHVSKRERSRRVTFQEG